MGQHHYLQFLEDDHVLGIVWRIYLAYLIYALQQFHEVETRIFCSWQMGKVRLWYTCRSPPAVVDEALEDRPVRL